MPKRPKTFLPGGGLCLQATGLPCAPVPTGPPVDPRPKLRPNGFGVGVHFPRFPRRSSHCSRAVFRSWHPLHRLCRLCGSQNNVQSPRWGLMWSTTVARVRIPFWAQDRQKGSRSSCPGRSSSFHNGRLYRSCHRALAFRSALAGLCAGQYPSRVSFPHPGWRQGRMGRIAIGSPPSAKKEPTGSLPRWKSVNRLLAQRLLALDIHFEFIAAGPAFVRQFTHHGIRPDRE